MKQPNTIKERLKLQRLMDRSDFAQLLYFERVVIVDSETLNFKGKGNGYQYVCVTKTHFFAVDIDNIKSRKELGTGFPLAHVSNVEGLSDAAKFLPDDISDDSQHVRIEIDDQLSRADIPPTSTIHFYTFYEDTRLFHMLNYTWIHVQSKLAIPSFYGPEAAALKEGVNLAHAGAPSLALTLSRPAVEQLVDGLTHDLSSVSSALPSDSREEYAAYQTDLAVQYTSVLEQITQLCSASDEAVEMFCGNANPLISFLISQLFKLIDMKVFLVDTNETMQQLLATTAFTPEQATARLEFLIAIYCCIWQLMAGHQAVDNRMELVSRTDYTLNEILDAIMLFGGTIHTKLTGAQYLAAERRRQRTVQSLTDAARRPHPDSIVMKRAWAALERRSDELDVMQMNVIFHMFELFESAKYSPNEEYHEFSLDNLFEFLMNNDEMIEQRMPAFVYRLAELLEQPHTSTRGLWVYQYSSLLRRFVLRSSDMRIQIRKECATVLKHTLHVRNQKMFLKMMHSRYFFYPKAIEPLDVFLKEIAKRG